MLLSVIRCGSEDPLNVALQGPSKQHAEKTKDAAPHREDASRGQRCFASSFQDSSRPLPPGGSESHRHGEGNPGTTALPKRRTRSAPSSISTHCSTLHISLFGVTSGSTGSPCQTAPCCCQNSSQSGRWRKNACVTRALCYLTRVAFPAITSRPAAYMRVGVSTHELCSTSGLSLS